MQQLQTTVLNTITPGVNPIFIISASDREGEILASLLSKNIHVSESDPNTSENSFSNAQLERLYPVLRNSAPEKQQEYLDSLKFIIDTGLDNGQLLGIKLDYKLFFDLKLESVFPNGRFIFIYGSVEKSGSTGIYIDSILEFYERNMPNSTLLHVKNITECPEVTLSSLPFSKGVYTKALESTAYTSSPIDYYEESNELIQQLNENNLLVQKDAWFSGNDILAIFFVGTYANHDVILNKVKTFKNSFLTSPQIHIVCRNNAEKGSILKLLASSFSNIDAVSVTTLEENLSVFLNDVIAHSSCSHIVIDQLNLVYPVEFILAPYKRKNRPAFIFNNLVSNKLNEDAQSDNITLTDVLISRSIPDNFSFTKSTWREISGFDEAFVNHAAIWDFCIRSIETEGFGMEIKGNIANVDASSDVNINIIPETDYKLIVAKHKTLFENNLDGIIKSAAESQYTPHNEILKLNKKISSLDELTSYLYHQVNALNNVKAQLEQRINVIENKWHYKLARKIGHFKNIFFKEKAGSGAGILKMVKFLLFAFTKPGLSIIRKIFKGGFRKLYLVAEDRPVKIVYLDNTNVAAQVRVEDIIDNYHDWIVRKLDIETLRSDYNNTISSLKLKPKISIIMPVYNPPVEYLKQAIESVLDQTYDNWELCIADDCSPNPQIKRILTVYAARDNRIKVIFREKNGHISANSNSALSLATGDYVALLDHDDLYTPHSLFEVVKYINAHPEVKFIYSDEDKVNDARTFSDPFFKPDWSPDRLLAINYICHLAVIERTLINKINGFREGFEGSQDYDLFLRLSEQTDKIGHIPHVLYHWRIHDASVAGAGEAKPYAYIAAQKAIQEALSRRQIPATVKFSELKGSYRIDYKIASYKKVSIVIPTKDQAMLMKNTIDSIMSLTDYPDYEVIVLNNNSSTKEFFDLMEGYTNQYPDKFRCIDALFPFNFSKLINLGVSFSTGEYILMLNNDVEILQKDWISKMVSYAQQERIGVVGVRLLYPNDHIQHAGTIIGLGDVAGHLHVGIHKDAPGYFNCLKLPTNYAAVTAACLMCRKDVYEEVGGMDETLEVEYNDVDFCLKFIDHGYYNIYTPEVTLYHYESVSRGHPHQNKVSYERHLREVKYFKDKWSKYIKNDPYYNSNLSYATADFRIDFNK